MFRNCQHTTFTGETKLISQFTKEELLRAYTAILSSLGQVGVYEPVAEGIRSEWHYRQYDKQKLWKIDRCFKNLKTAITSPEEKIFEKIQESS